MTQQNKNTIRTALIVLLFVIIAIFLRNMWRIIDTNESIDFITGVLRALIYIFMFAWWGFSLQYRIVQKQARHYLVAVSIVMVFWIFVRALKFLFFNTTSIGRYLWYLYYFPQLFIPILALLMALSLGKSEKYKVSHWMNISFVISSILLLLVLTNDYHQSVFGFPYGTMHYENNEYTHLWGYYLIIVWIAFCAIAAFVIIIKKCRIPSSKKHFFLPLIPISMLIIYGVLYIVAPNLLHMIAGDMTVTICVLTMFSFESCIICGLIQSNTHYNELFECTSIKTKIVDQDYKTLLSSTDNNTLSETVMRQTENGSVMVDDGMRLCGAKISGGHVLWLEDVSKMSEVIAELADNSEYLNARKMVLRQEVETRREEQRLNEQNRLYNQLINNNQDKYESFENLLSQIETINDVEQEKKLIVKLAIVCTHIKRCGNLLFLVEKDEDINAMELQFALEEWISTLRLCGVKCNLYFEIDSNLSYSQIVGFYDSFQKVLLEIVDNLKSLLVTVENRNGSPCILLNISCDKDLTAVSYPNISIEAEDEGEWIVMINVNEEEVTI